MISYYSARLLFGSSLPPGPASTSICPGSGRRPAASVSPAGCAPAITTPLSPPECPQRSARGWAVATSGLRFPPNFGPPNSGTNPSRNSSRRGARSSTRRTQIRCALANAPVCCSLPIRASARHTVTSLGAPSNPSIPNSAASRRASWAATVPRQPLGQRQPAKSRGVFVGEFDLDRVRGAGLKRCHHRQAPCAFSRRPNPFLAVLASVG